MLLKYGIVEWRLNNGTVSSNGFQKLHFLRSEDNFIVHLWEILKSSGNNIAKYRAEHIPLIS